MRFFPAKQPGKKANDRTIDVSVTGMTCQKCVEHITAALESLETVKRVSVLLRSNCLLYTSDAADDLLTV